jgi:hypothetical protein
MNKILKLLEVIVEAFSFMKIVLSPLLIGLFIGIVIYANKTDNVGLIIGGGVTFTGLIAGILLALWARKNSGSAVEFNARVNASPDIDEIIKKDKSNQ